MLNLSVRELVIIVPVILVSLTVHELAHAATALAFGDDTGKRDGRITLNPLRHVDPIGFLLLVVAGFGWAKPVRFDRSRLGSPVRDEILIALAGPASNLVLAFVGAIVIRAVMYSGAAGAALEAVFEVAFIFSTINIALALFNALPIPPLDGSHVYTSFISERSAAAAAAVTKYGFLVLVAVILLQRVLGVDLIPIGRFTRSVLGLMLRVLGAG